MVSGPRFLYGVKLNNGMGIKSLVRGLPGTLFLFDCWLCLVRVASFNFPYVFPGVSFCSWVPSGVSRSWLWASMLRSLCFSFVELASFRFGLRLGVHAVGGWCLIVLSSSFACCGSTDGFCDHFGPSSSAALSVICGRLWCCCGSPSSYVLVGRWSPSSVSAPGLLAVASFLTLSRSQRRCSGRLAGCLVVRCLPPSCREFSVMLAGCTGRCILVRGPPAVTDTG